MLGGHSFKYVSFTFSSELLSIFGFFSIALLNLYMPHSELLEKHWGQFVFMRMEEPWRDTVIAISPSLQLLSTGQD